MYEGHIVTERYACGKDNLYNAAFCKLLGGFVRHTVINGRNLALNDLKLLHHLIDELDGVLKSSSASHLHHHRHLSELRLVGAIYEVILIDVVFLRIEVEVNYKSLALDVKLNKLNSALIERLIVPAASSLDALIGKDVILDLGVEGLNVLGRLDESGHEGASEADTNRLAAYNSCSVLAALTHNENRGLGFLSHGLFLCCGLFLSCGLFLCDCFLSYGLGFLENHGLSLVFNYRFLVNLGDLLLSDFLNGLVNLGNLLGLYCYGLFLYDRLCRFLSCGLCSLLCLNSGDLIGSSSLVLSALKEEVNAYRDTCGKKHREKYPEPYKASALNLSDRVDGEVVGLEAHIVAVTGRGHELCNAVRIYVDYNELVIVYITVICGDKKLNLEGLTVYGNVLAASGEVNIVSGEDLHGLTVDLIGELNVGGYAGLNKIIGVETVSCLYLNDDLAAASNLVVVLLVTVDDKSCGKLVEIDGIVTLVLILYADSRGDRIGTKENYVFNIVRNVKLCKIVCVAGYREAVRHTVVGDGSRGKLKR